MLKLLPENTIVDIPDLNRFQIGDHVIVDANADYDRFEGFIIGIELRRMHGSNYLAPSITILHDGCITDEFKPIDCRKVDSTLQPIPGGWKPVASLKKGPHAVWLAHTCGYMSPAYFNPAGDGFWVHLYTNLPIDWRPTHWQELPTPPALAATSEGSEG